MTSTDSNIFLSECLKNAADNLPQYEISFYWMQRAIDHLEMLHNNDIGNSENNSDITKTNIKLDNNIKKENSTNHTVSQVSQASYCFCNSHVSCSSQPDHH